MAVDYRRSMAAYKVGAEGGDTICQWQLGYMYFKGQGVDVDYAQALPWIEKAAAQDLHNAVCTLGAMYLEGKGVTPSLRRAREYYEKAIKLGSSVAVKNMQNLTMNIPQVTSRRSNHSALSPPLERDLTLPHPPFPLPSYAQTLMDKRVEIHGTSRADTNGKRGVATDFQVPDGRTIRTHDLALHGQARRRRGVQGQAGERAGGGGGRRRRCRCRCGCGCGPGEGQGHRQGQGKEGAGRAQVSE